jgi:hypothetical protein
MARCGDLSENLKLFRRFVYSHASRCHIIVRFTPNYVSTCEEIFVIYLVVVALLTVSIKNLHLITHEY